MNIIPKPQEISANPRAFILTPNSKIQLDAGSKKPKSILEYYLNLITNLKIIIESQETDSENTNIIALSLDSALKTLDAEGCVLNITQDAVFLSLI